MREIIIKIPDTAYEGILNADKAGGNWGEDLLGILCNAITHGTLIPEGHGRLIDGNYLLGTLLCEDYETCVWRNCSECEYNRAKTDRWIPVSERLPEENKSVIASTKYGVFPEAKYTKEYGWEWAYEAGADYWKELEEVTAWMPLPKPYEPQESESKRYMELAKSYVQGLRDGLAERSGKE